MVCTTVTVQAPVQSKPEITAFVATPRNDTAGTIDFNWTQSIAGNVQLFINNTASQTFRGNAGSSNGNSLSGFTPGTYTLCIIPV